MNAAAVVAHNSVGDSSKSKLALNKRSNNTNLDGEGTRVRCLGRRWHGQSACLRKDTRRDRPSRRTSRKGATLQNPSFEMHYLSFLIHNSSFSIQISSFLLIFTQFYSFLLIVFPHRRPCPHPFVGANKLPRHGRIDDRDLAVEGSDQLFNTKIIIVNAEVIICNAEYPLMQNIY